MFFVVPKTEGKERGESEKDNEELIYFVYKAGGVNSYRFSEEVKASGLGEEFCCGYCGDDDNSESCEDGDAASEGDDGLAVPVFYWF